MSSDEIYAIENSVSEQLAQIFPNLNQQMINISIKHPSNRSNPLNVTSLIQRCIDDLLELRTFTERSRDFVNIEDNSTTSFQEKTSYRELSHFIESDDSEEEIIQFANKVENGEYYDLTAESSQEYNDLSTSQSEVRSTLTETQNLPHILESKQSSSKYVLSPAKEFKQSRNIFSLAIELKQSVSDLSHVKDFKRSTGVLSPAKQFKSASVLSPSKEWKEWRRPVFEDIEPDDNLPKLFSPSSARKISPVKNRPSSDINNKGIHNFETFSSTPILNINKLQNPKLSPVSSADCANDYISSTKSAFNFDKSAFATQSVTEINLTENDNEKKISDCSVSVLESDKKYMMLLNNLDHDKTESSDLHKKWSEYRDKNNAMSDNNSNTIKGPKSDSLESSSKQTCFIGSGISSTTCKSLPPHMKTPDICLGKPANESALDGLKASTSGAGVHVSQNFTLNTSRNSSAKFVSSANSTITQTPSSTDSTNTEISLTSALNNSRNSSPTFPPSSNATFSQTSTLNTSRSPSATLVPSSNVTFSQTTALKNMKNSSATCTLAVSSNSTVTCSHTSVSNISSSSSATIPSSFNTTIVLDDSLHFLPNPSVQYQSDTEHFSDTKKGLVSEKIPDSTAGNYRNVVEIQNVLLKGQRKENICFDHGEKNYAVTNCSAVGNFPAKDKILKTSMQTARFSHIANSAGDTLSNSASHTHTSTSKCTLGAPKSDRTCQNSALNISSTSSSAISVSSMNNSYSVNNNESSDITLVKNVKPNKPCVIKTSSGCFEVNASNIGTKLKKNKIANTNKVNSSKVPHHHTGEDLIIIDRSNEEGIITQRQQNISVTNTVMTASDGGHAQNQTSTSVKEPEPVLNVKTVSATSSVRQKEVSPATVTNETFPEPVVKTPEMIFEDMRQQVLMLFPDVDPDYLNRLLQHEAGPVALNNICNHLLEINYPKKQQSIPSVDKEAVVDNSVKPSPKPVYSKNYYTDYSDRIVDPRYRIQCEAALQNEFHWISVKDIRLLLATYFNGHYAPTHKVLREIMKKRQEDAKNVDSRSHSQAKVEMSLKLGETEKQFKLTFLKCPRGNRYLSSVVPELQTELNFVADKLLEQAQEDDRQLAAEINEIEYEETGQLIECGCCFGEVPFENMVQCYEGHLFCQDCLKNYAKEAVFGQGKADLMCMTDGCDATYPASQLNVALPSNILEKYEDRVKEENINLADLADLVRCPNCDFAALMDPNDKVFKCQNLTCMKETCRYCKEDWTEHFGKRCEEIEKKDETKLRLEFEEKMTEAKIRTCHKCKARFTKLEGCNKMTCRCGAKMCYICRKPISDYSHFCQHVRNPGNPCDKCNSCFLWSNPEEDEKRAIEEIRKQANEARIEQGYTEEKYIGAKESSAPPNKKQRVG